MIFAPAAGPRTVIVPILNGMRHIDVLTERFGKDAVVGGVCYVATEMDSQSRIIQLADFQSLDYGELDGKKTSRIEAVHHQDICIIPVHFGYCVQPQKRHASR